MKKTILLLTMLFIAVASYAVDIKIKYQVTISTQMVYTYYSSDGSEVGNDTAFGKSEVIDVYAETAYEAEKEALMECGQMCQRISQKYEGKRKYGGQLYDCYSTRRPYSVDAVIPKN